MKPLKIISIIAVTLMCWEAGGRLVIFLFQTGLEDWQLQQSTGQWTYVLSSISIWAIALMVLLLVFCAPVYAFSDLDKDMQ